MQVPYDHFPFTCHFYLHEGKDSGLGDMMQDERQGSPPIDSGNKKIANFRPIHLFCEERIQSGIDLTLCKFL